MGPTRQHVILGAVALLAGLALVLWWPAPGGVVSPGVAVGSPAHMTAKREPGAMMPLPPVAIRRWAEVAPEATDVEPVPCVASKARSRSLDRLLQLDEPSLGSLVRAQLLRAARDLLLADEAIALGDVEGCDVVITPRQAADAWARVCAGLAPPQEDTGYDADVYTSHCP